MTRQGTLPILIPTHKVREKAIVQRRESARIRRDSDGFVTTMPFVGFERHSFGSIDDPREFVLRLAKVKKAKGTVNMKRMLPEPSLAGPFKQPSFARKRGS